MKIDPILDRKSILERLKLIFPEGTPDRDKCIRDATAATVFSMLYIGAVEGSNLWLGPVHVVRMSDKQALKQDQRSRAGFGINRRLVGKRWYAENSREQIRDEVLRQGLIPNGAVVYRSDLPTTSSKPRYALKTSFADLFDATLDDSTFAAKARAWRDSNLSAAALARISARMRSASAGSQATMVRLPSGETKLMAVGPSSEICRAVLEEFAPRFLANPAVLWLSESRQHVIEHDARLVAKLRQQIDPSRNLPDLILADLGETQEKFLLVFVEAVATDGPMTEKRRADLATIATEAGYRDHQVSFVTAYLDRDRAEFKKTVASLAWQSFAWFASEPSHILFLHSGERSKKRLRDFVAP